MGNLIEDKQEGTAIDWNVYGKVSQVRKADGTTLSFRYDAAGNRVEKKVISPSGAGGLSPATCAMLPATCWPFTGRRAAGKKASRNSPFTAAVGWDSTGAEG
jgi:YD repeat-containing protein